MKLSLISKDDIRPKIRALPNTSLFSVLMRETLLSIMRGENSLEVEQIDSADATISGVPLYTLDGNELRILDNVYELTPELHKTLSSRAYTGKTTKKT